MSPRAFRCVMFRFISPFLFVQGVDDRTAWSVKAVYLKTPRGGLVFDRFGAIVQA
jgi:hypothetical protein